MKSEKDLKHRAKVGGRWEEIGRLQFDFLLEQGLKQNHKLLDIGCGCLRGGRFFIDYLEPGHYFGVDRSRKLIQAGIEKELTRKQREKIDRGSFLVTSDFTFCALGQVFEFALAQSLFTHLPIASIQVCLDRLARVMLPGGSLYATAFLYGDGQQRRKPCEGYQHACWYDLHDFEMVISNMPWILRYHGDWGHPRNQKMLVFTKTGAD